MGSMKVAKELIDLASNAGADAVKFQAFKADNLILNDIAVNPNFAAIQDSLLKYCSKSNISQ